MINLKGTKMTLEEALEKANPGDTIILENKTYHEKCVVNKKNITLIGDELTEIEYDTAATTIIPVEKGGDGIKTYGTTGSATFTVLPEADGFKAFSITFKNSFDRRKNEGQAVAFKSSCNDLLIENCRFISMQDTLYIDYGKNNKINNSYIEGDIDFIFGSADCTFNNCKIVGLNSQNVYFVAPSTLEQNKKGFHFKYCEFIANNELSYLGRLWFPTKALGKTFPRLKIKNCKFSGNFLLDLIPMKKTDLRIYFLQVKDSNLNGDTIHQIFTLNK